MLRAMQGRARSASSAVKQPGEEGGGTKQPKLLKRGEALLKFMHESGFIEEHDTYHRASLHPRAFRAIAEKQSAVPFDRILEALHPGERYKPYELSGQLRAVRHLVEGLGRLGLVKLIRDDHLVGTDAHTALFAGSLGLNERFYTAARLTESGHRLYNRIKRAGLLEMFTNKNPEEWLDDQAAKRN